MPRIAQTLLRALLAAAAASLVLTGTAGAVHVSNRLPVKTSSTGAPQVSGEAIVGGTLSTTTGSWSFAPSSYAFQWLLCDSHGRKCSALTGLTAEEVVVPAQAAGRTMRVQVTATGSGHKATATSAPTAAIASPPPVEAGSGTESESTESTESGSESTESTSEPEPEPGSGESPPPPPASGSALFEDRFEYPDGLITNEYAHWNPSSPEAQLSSVWEMTSGSLFAQDGTGWTGVPDGCSTSSPQSSPCTASDVFRLNTVEHDFGDVTVSLDLRNNSLTSSSRTPPEDWDGVHVWLHYQSEYQLYYASFNRRDGHIVIKKKCLGGSENGGTYYELGSGEASGYPIPFGVWQHIAASIQDNPDGSVTITMSRDGTKLLSATDSGLGCAPITAAGSVGVRGDNDDFNIDNFVVTAG